MTKVSEKLSWRRCMLWYWSCPPRVNVLLLPCRRLWLGLCPNCTRPVYHSYLVSGGGRKPPSPLSHHWHRRRLENDRCDLEINVITQGMLRPYSVPDDLATNPPENIGSFILRTYLRLEPKTFYNLNNLFNHGIRLLNGLFCQDRMY